MARKGLFREQAEGKLPEFPLFGRGDVGTGQGIAFDTPFLWGRRPHQAVASAGRMSGRGRQDRDLPAGFRIMGGGRRQPYRQAQQIVGGHLMPSRIPTPGYEQAFLGMGNLRFRERDWARDIPYPLSRLEAPYGMGIDHISTRPFNDEVTGPWVRAIQQEVYTQYNRGIPGPWER